MKNKLAILLLIVLPIQATADAIVRSTAMFANTIAEYYVEKDHVRLELEIGEADIASFRNLLPDQIFQQLESTLKSFDQDGTHKSQSI